MKLSELLSEFCEGAVDIEINSLVLDSRKVIKGNAFLAVNGSQQHGLIHAPQAIANGALAVIYDPNGFDIATSPLSVFSLAIPDLDQHLSAIAAKFYAYPSKQLQVIGVTGTNGKTTCTQLIAQALANCGVIGTIGWGEPGKLLSTDNTTPDALTIQQLLSQFVQQGKLAVAMEVSSHGLQQGRVKAVDFKGAVFTNLTRDHLDYHASMAEYLQAKLGLFVNPGLNFAVVNLDDAYAPSVLEAIAENVQIWTFSSKARTLAGAKSLVAENINHTPAGIHFDLVCGDFRSAVFSPLTGAFNLDNILAVLSVLLAVSVPFEEAIVRLAKLKGVPGRMEKFGGSDKPTVFVDYAHTPDALEKVLNAAKGFDHLSVVFGCGGDRDKGKRPQMGKIAETLADEVIITDDNPRTESPTEIVKQILAGCKTRKISVIHDRSLAIKTAIQKAATADCVVVAGKGHETYQEVAGIRLPFSDQEVIKQSLATWSCQR